MIRLLNRGWLLKLPIIIKVFPTVWIHRSMVLGPFQCPEPFKLFGVKTLLVPAHINFSFLCSSLLTDYTVLGCLLFVHRILVCQQWQKAFVSHLVLSFWCLASGYPESWLNWFVGVEFYVQYLDFSLQHSELINSRSNIWCLYELISLTPICWRRLFCPYFQMPKPSQFGWGSHSIPNLYSSVTTKRFNNLALANTFDQIFACCSVHSNPFVYA